MSQVQTTITNLPQAGPIQGTEAVPIVQNGVTKQTTTAAIAAAPSQFQTFLTINQETTLPNSRYLSTGTGLGLADGGAQSYYRITLNGASGSLEAASNGFVVKTNASTVTNRSIAVTGNGLAITNGNGVSGNPTIALDGLSASLAGMSGSGLVAVLSGSTVTPRSIVGVADQTSVTNGNGFAGSPTIGLADNAILPGTGSVTLPIGTAAQQPAGSDGQVRYDSTASAFYGYSSGAWRQFSLAGGVTLINTGTGLLGGPITSTGTITIDTSVVATLTGTQTLTNKTISGLNNTLTNIGNGSLVNSSVTIGSDAVSLGGTITTFNGVSISGSANTLSNIGNASLTNSSLTYNGVTVALGAGGTITAVNPFALTIGTGLSGSSYDGSGNVTVAIDSTVATLTGTQTLTNKSISGSTNTLSNIGNSSLTNSSITLGTSNIALGATELAPAGLTSVTVTQNPTTALQLATKQYVDTLVSSGITYHTPVKYEVPNSTGNLNATYNQPGGAGVGVGATLTNAGTLAAFAPDGTVALVNDRVLIYSQTNAFENGVYTVTVVGNGSTAWVLTRATDADTYALKNPNGLGEGDAFFITSGNTGAGETYVMNTQGVITFGTTAINFVQVSAAQVYSAGTGLTLTNTTFSITNTAVTAASYGSASSVATFTVNAQGQLTAAATTAISINGNQITSGTVGSAYISGSYTGITGVGTLTAGTWNATTIDSGYGGTGLASYTAGDMIYATGTTTLAKLAIGATNYVLTSTGAAPQYVAQSTLSVGSATNATNAANVAVTAVSTNASFYPTFVSATTGNLTVDVDSDLTYNPSTNTLTAGTVTATTGIFGGTF